LSLWSRIEFYTYFAVACWSSETQLRVCPLPPYSGKKIKIYNYNEILMIFEALTGKEPSRNDWVFLSMDNHYKVIFFGNIFDIP